MLSDGFLLEQNLGAKLKFMVLSSVGRITVDYDWFRWYDAISQDNDNSNNTALTTVYGAGQPIVKRNNRECQLGN